MKRLRSSVGLIALAGLAACSSPAPAGGAGATAKATGIQASCINPIDIDRQEIVSDQEVRFTMRNGDVWVNRLPHACYGLKNEGGFAWGVRGTLVCSNQQNIKVLRLGTPCQLGEFTKLPKAPKPAT